MFKRIQMITLLASIALFAAAGCGGGQAHEGGSDGTPGWVNQGGGAMSDKAFYGVGVAQGVSSISLRRSTADASARTELAKVFTTKVKNMIKSYEASTNDGEKEAYEAHRQEATKAFTEMELTGAQIVDRYYDNEQGVQYSLARLDPDAFEAQLDRMAKLSSRAKQIIRANAQKAFEELDAESDRNKEE